MKCLQFGSATKKISPTIRRFCFTLHYYSPRAYEYLRETFNQHLPTARTLRSWYSAIDAVSGLTEASFDALKQRADDKKKCNENERLLVGLVHDAMFIRQHSQWDKAGKKYLGHNMTRNEADICLPLASQALVYMVCGIEEDFKLPIGYYLNNGSNAQEVADAIKMIMRKLSDAGVTLVSITYDGATENIAAGRLLGATLEKPYILNTFDEDNKVYLILDTPHMLKLVRNCLANKGTLFDEKDKAIEWKLIKDLVDLQITEKVNLGNKLTKTHVDFQDRKMNVRLAAKTVSKSTAHSLEFADNVLSNPKFSNSAATVEYLLVFNNLFDVMNSKLNHYNEEYKRPFSEHVMSYFNQFFNYAKIYINGLQVIENGKKVSILRSRSYTPFFGFLQNIESFKGIFNDYGVKKFHTFSVSQDHLESFFGCIRRMNGCNDNPSEQQFAAAYKKLLFHNEIKSSNHSNCQNDVTKILYISSAKKVTSKPDIRSDLNKLEDFDCENFDEGCSDTFETNSTKLQNHARAYMASIVELGIIEKIFGKGKKKCLKCIDVLIENEITDDEFIAFKFENSHIHQPCKSTLDIIQYTETRLKKYEEQEIHFEALIIHILNNVDMSRLYPLSEFGDDQHDPSHKSNLVRLIVETYLDKKSTDFSQVMTRMLKTKLVRQKNLKDVHRVGQ